MTIRFSGSAAKGIEGKLKRSGVKLVTSSLIAYVEGDPQRNEWAQEIAEALSK